MKNKVLNSLNGFFKTASLPMFATILGLLLGAITIFLSGNNPFEVYAAMFSKSFFDPFYLNETLVRVTLVVLCGISGAIAWRAGHINLGIEGQMVCGAVAALLVGLFMPGPDFLVVICACLAACIAGAIYALIPTVLQDKAHVSMIIVTLMMNYIANYISSYLATYPLKDPTSLNANQTETIRESLRFFKLASNGNLSFGFILSILVVVAIYFVMNHTVFGYESKMTGFNPSFAKYGGVNERKGVYLTMALSGAIAGFAGFVEVFGAKYRFIANMISSASYAWTGLMASLVGQYNPIAIFIYSVFFSGLSIGGQALQRDFSIPLQIADIITCSIMLFVSINIGFNVIKKRKRYEEDHNNIEATKLKEETTNE